MSQPSDKTWAQHLHSETRSAQSLEQMDLDVKVPGLTILGHPDCRRVGEAVALPELGSGRPVLLSRHEPHFALPGASLRRPLADPFLSRRPTRLAPAPNQGVLIQPAAGNPSLTVDDAGLEAEHQVSIQDLERGVVLMLSQRVVLLLHRVNPSPPRGVPSFDMIGDSLALLDVRRQIAAIASLDGPVLLRGETGCGKELVAAALHRASSRKDQPYLTVNVGAIPTSLAAAELFGAARGAFTGADRQRRGYFARANGGTLLLDEVGEMPPEIQVLLLRVLEDGEVHTVGSEKLQRVDVRVIAATDADLEANIAAGTFRAPLLHRLSAQEIRVPPLRARRDDIGRLLVHFLGLEIEATDGNPGWLRSGPEDTLWLPAPLVARLAAYSWPGNVRQLRNVARQLVTAGRNRPQTQLGPQLESLLVSDSPVNSTEDNTLPVGPAKDLKKSYRPVTDVGEDELLDVLRANRWKLQPTATVLGVSRTALYSLIATSPKVRKPRQLSRQQIELCQERCGGNIESMVDELQVSRKGLRRRMTELGLP